MPTTKLVLSLLVLAGVVAAIPTAAEQTLNGDESWELKIKCDSQAQMTTITSYQHPVQSVGPGEKSIGREATCKVGTLSVRVQPLPIKDVSGMCGYSPPAYFHMWVNGKKVLADHALSALCGGAALHDISISAAGIKVCDYQNLNPDDSEPGLPVTAEDALSHPVKCKTLALP